MHAPTNPINNKEKTMKLYPISFPNLNISLFVNPVAISIFGVNIHWYGILIVSAILIGLALAKRDDRLHKIKFDDVFDFALIGIFIGIICARIYFVIFNLNYYINHPNEIFSIWNGGLAIYGGIIGGVLSAAIFCKVRKINFLDLCDYLVPFLALGQAIGRWGNFINQEAYGYATENFFKMRIYSEELGSFINVHPTFLYESILDLFIFAILMILRKKRKFNGQLLYLYLIIYGIGRAIIEGFRTDSLMLLNFRVSQIFSIFLVILAIILYYFGEKCRPKD